MSRTENNFFKEFSDPRSIDAHELSNAVAEAGYDWVDKDAAANVLEEAKRSLLSQIALELMRSPSGNKAMSRTEADARALADERYKAHVNEMIEARKIANRAKVRYDMGKTFIELTRSAHATRRQEARFGSIAP